MSVLAGVAGVSLAMASAVIPGVEEFLNFWVTLIVGGGAVLLALVWLIRSAHDTWSLDREMGGGGLGGGVIDGLADALARLGGSAARGDTGDTGEPGDTEGGPR